MNFPDLTPALQKAAPELRGRLEANVRMADLCWFRTGGPAQALFTPADEEDLAYFLARLDPGVAVTTVGVGSNLLVRDGGIKGVVVRLGKGFHNLRVDGSRIEAGARILDVKLAAAAAEAGIAGLAFYRGIPGAVGGALRMNAGAYGAETKDVLVSCRGIDRKGALACLQQCRHGLHLSSCECAAGRDLHIGIVRRAGRASAPRSKPKWPRSRDRGRRASR